MINRSLNAGALITNSTSIDIFNFNDYSVVIKVLNDKVIAKTKAGKTHTINLKLDETFYWHECDKNGVSPEVKYDLEKIRKWSNKMTKITQDAFLNRIMTSDNSIQEAFTIEGLKALHGSLYKFYSETFPKDFHVEILLRTWQEFDTLDTAKAYCQKNTRHFDIKDVIIFDTGVLLFQR